MLQTYESRFSEMHTSVPLIASIWSPLHTALLDRMARSAHDRGEQAYRFFGIETDPASPDLRLSRQRLEAFQHGNAARSAGERSRTVVRKPFPWIRQVLQGLEELRQSEEHDGPPPSPVALAQAQELLVFLANHVNEAPCVTELPTRAVGIEFYGRPKGRVMCVVRADGSASCSGLIQGQSRYASFETWRDMMGQDGGILLRRLGVYGGAGSAAS